MTACSVEEAQNTLTYAQIELLGGISDDWFGIESSDFKDGGDPYSNNRDYIKFNYDKKTVEESKLAELPEYDLSGPKGSTPSQGESNLDETLLGSATEATENTEVTTVSNGKKVYLAPICCGLDSTGYLARTVKGFNKLKGSSKSFTINDYKKSLKGLKNPTDSKNFGQNRFKGKHDTLSQNNPSTNKTAIVNNDEWMFCWNWCKRIGDELKKNDCDVIYAYDATTCTNANSDPSTFWGGKATWTIQDIAEDIAKEDPDYVIWVGLNENDFGSLPKESMDVANSTTKKTVFLYGDGTGSKTFANKISKNWGNVKELDESIQRAGVFKRSKFTGDKASVMGAQKAATCLTALRINGYNKPSVAILFGNYKTNMMNGKAQYSYSKVNSLAVKFGEIIGKSL